MSLFKTTKCKICRSNPGHRFCLRKGKDICWDCCNEMRIDRKCPQECSYTLKSSEDLNLQTKADSIAEFTDLQKKQIEKWITLPQDIFNGEIPRNMVESEEGKDRLIEFINQFQINSLMPLSYLKEKLSLDKLKVISQDSNYEDAAIKFLEFVILQEWDKTVDFLAHKNVYEDPDLRNNYLDRLQNNKVLKKLTSYFLVSSALSDNKKQALVYIQLNGKYDLTLVFRLVDDQWLISEKVFGKPEIVNSESQARQQIALMLSKNNLSQAYELLQKYSNIYVDSADIAYYHCTYYMLSKNDEKAFPFIKQAVELDPNFIQAKGIYATFLAQKNETEKAKILYEEIIRANPQDINSMNNLASIYIEAGKKIEAKKLLERCLAIDPNFEYAKKNLERIK